MAYRLIITERAEELLEQQVNYILYKFRNEQAARHLLDGIEQLYDRLEDNPYQFADCRDSFLKSKGYNVKHQAIKCLMLFRILKEVVIAHHIRESLINFSTRSVPVQYKNNHTMQIRGQRPLYQPMVQWITAHVSRQPIHRMLTRWQQMRRAM